jgi:putative membrane-bound dehydrogenase-like protein
LAQREAEKRKKHPQVANYEKRPEPLTFQLPIFVKGSMERTQVPADCELKLFASEPDIAKPIAFAWDERGRCWVVETRDYPHGVSENGEGEDSVKICEDTDGDGKADKFTVFADKLNLPTGIVFARKGIIVAAPPKFIYLEDTDGDDKADKRETIIDCWGIKRHARAGQQPALRLRQLDLRLRRLQRHRRLRRRQEASVRDGNVSLQAGRQRHRVPASVHQQRLGAQHNDAGDQFGGTANGAPIFFGGIPATAYAEGSTRHDREEDQRGRYLPHHHAELPPGGCLRRLHRRCGLELHLQRRACRSAFKAWPWSANPR